MSQYGYGAQNDAKIAGTGGVVMPTAPQTITLPYPPTANHFKVPVQAGRGVRMILSKEARQYKETVANILSRYTFSLLTGPITVHVDLFRPRKVGDLENGLKVAIDCLSGVAFEDDKQIVSLHAYRHDDKQNPRIEITVRAVTEWYLGVK